MFFFLISLINIYLIAVVKEVFCIVIILALGTKKMVK